MDVREYHPEGSKIGTSFRQTTSLPHMGYLWKPRQRKDQIRFQCSRMECPLDAGAGDHDGLCVLGGQCSGRFGAQGAPSGATPSLKRLSVWLKSNSLIVDMTSDAGIEETDQGGRISEYRLSNILGKRWISKRTNGDRRGTGVLGHHRAHGRERHE